VITLESSASRQRRAGSVSDSKKSSDRKIEITHAYVNFSPSSSGAPLLAAAAAAASAAAPAFSSGVPSAPTPPLALLLLATDN
jgi:hypothetical protein